VGSVGLQRGEQVQRQPAGPLPRPGRRAWLAGALLILLTLALYYPVRSHPFVNYDDNVYVTANEHVQAGLSLVTLRWALVTYEAGNWHPLTWLSHALDVELFSLDAGRHHQVSTLLHALNAALLFWVLLRATGYAGRSFMVAALFAVHPINVETVVWIAERKTVLSMLFFLLALGAYRWYALSPKPGRYAVVAALFALGLMAKPQVITLPFVLLLWDYWPLGRLAVRSLPLSVLRKDRHELSGEKPTANSKVRWLIAEKLPLFVLAAASAVMTMKAQWASGAVLGLAGTPFSVRLANAIVSYVRYIKKALWPSHLALLYPHPGKSLPGVEVYGSLLLLLAITMLVLEQRRRGYLLVGWLWFLGTLVPMIGLVQVGRQAMADRYAYLPLIGIFIMLCWGAPEAFGSAVGRRAAVLLPVAGTLTIAALSVVARRQIGYWSDNVTLWRHTVAVTPPNYIAQDNLGGALVARDGLEAGIEHYRTAAALHPVDPISAFNIAFYEQRHGELALAIERYKRVMVLTPRASLKRQALSNMGYAYRALGQQDRARECFEAAEKMEGP